MSNHMALPKAYLTSTRNLDGILSAIQTAQAPPRFTISFLENLGYRSSSDRLIINVLKALGFLNADGSPTERYVPASSISPRRRGSWQRVSRRRMPISTS